jgi:hypothetical protein
MEQESYVKSALIDSVGKEMEIESSEFEEH